MSQKTRIPSDKARAGKNSEKKTPAATSYFSNDYDPFESPDDRRYDDGHHFSKGLLSIKESRPPGKILKPRARLHDLIVISSFFLILFLVRPVKTKNADNEFTLDERAGKRPCVKKPPIGWNALNGEWNALNGGEVVQHRRTGFLDRSLVNKPSNSASYVPLSNRNAGGELRDNNNGKPGVTLKFFNFFLFVLSIMTGFDCFLFFVFKFVTKQSLPAMKKKSCHKDVHFLTKLRTKKRKLRLLLLCKYSSRVQKHYSNNFDIKFCPF